MEFWVTEEMMNTSQSCFLQLGDEVFLCVVPMLLRVELERVQRGDKLWFGMIGPVQIVDLENGDPVAIDHAPELGKLIIGEQIRVINEDDFLLDRNNPDDREMVLKRLVE